MDDDETTAMRELALGVWFFALLEEGHTEQEAAAIIRSKIQTPHTQGEP